MASICQKRCNQHKNSNALFIRGCFYQDYTIFVKLLQWVFTSDNNMNLALPLSTSYVYGICRQVKPDTRNSEFLIVLIILELQAL